MTKRFAGADGAVTAVDGVDFDVGPGSAVSIVGPNGAGKSTLLGLIAGVAVPTLGSIHRTGRCASLLELGAGFHDDLTGRENLSLALALAGVAGAQRRSKLAVAAEFAGIGDAIDRPVKQLSSGMIARLACAAAFCTEPDILLIDEVLAVGDATFQHSALNEVARLVAEGSILLLVTHSPDLARTASTRTIWLENGAVRRDGPAGEVLAEYESVMRGWGRATAPGSVVVDEVRVSRAVIEPGAPLQVTAQLSCSEASGPVELRLEVRAAIGDDTFWMRSADENPETRAVNLIAWAPPVRIDDLAAGQHVVTLDLSSVPLTSTELELTVVVTDTAQRVISEASCELRIGDVVLRPFYLMPIHIGGTSDAAASLDSTAPESDDH